MLRGLFNFGVRSSAKVAVMALIPPFMFAAIWTSSAISSSVTPSCSTRPQKISVSSVLKLSRCSSSDALSCAILSRVSVVDLPASLNLKLLARPDSHRPYVHLVFFFLSSRLLSCPFSFVLVNQFTVSGSKDQVFEIISRCWFSINKKTVSVDLLNYFSILYTLNFVSF